MIPKSIINLLINQQMLNNFKIYPKSLLRIACTPFDYMEGNNTTLLNFFSQLNDNNNQINLLTNEILEELHLFNSSLTNEQEQRIIQNYRRALYNKKNDEKATLSALNVIPENYKIKIHKLIRLKKEINTILIEIQNEHARALDSDRRSLYSSMQNQLFLNGVYMSSESIYHYITKLVNSANENLHKKEITKDLGILKYLSRSSAKTSPFSTFTSVNLCDISNKKNIRFQPNGVVAKLTINSWLLNIIQHIITSDKELLGYMSVHLNSTLKVNKEEFRYVINLNNVETFQTVKLNSLLNELLNEFKKRKTLQINYLINRIKTKFQIDEDNAQQHLLSCINIGFIEIKKLSSAIDPNWNETLLLNLKKTFSKNNSLQIKIIIETLEYLNRITSTKSLFDVNHKNELIKIAKDKIGQIIEFSPKQQIEKNKHILKNIFFEDAKAQEHVSFKKNLITPVGETLAHLYNILGFLDYRKNEQLLMYEYFRKKYSINSKVSFLEFYEDYYRDIVLNKNKTPTNSTSSNKGYVISKYQKLKEQWTKSFLAAVTAINENKEEIFVNSAQIIQSNNEVKFQPNHSIHGSVGAFLQFTFKNNHLSGQHYTIVNSLFYGYGKMFSRFLHLFPKSAYKKIADNNTFKQNNEFLFAEVNDSSFHNANLHPPLLPYEIVFPGCHTRLKDKQQIYVNDIEIYADQKLKTLNLLHSKSKTPIFPLDLGFQSMKGRSEMFQLMTYFSKTDFNSYNTLTSIINHQIFQEKKNRYPIILPRIIYEGNIILQKKTWIIDKKSIPIQENGATEAIYHFMIIQWKNSLGIPDHIFFRLYSRKIAFDTPDKGTKDYKPQYINFNSPLFIKLFQKLINKAQYYIEIEEMLPAPNDLLQIDGSKKVSEFYIQIDNC